MTRRALARVPDPRDPRRLVAAYLDARRREIVCGFDGGNVVRIGLRALGIASKPRVVHAAPDEFGAGLLLVREDGSLDDCGADLVLFKTDDAYRARHSFSHDVNLGKRVGERLKGLRRARGLTQRATAARLGLAPPNYARLESGRHVPSVTTLVRIAATLGVPLERLVSRRPG